MSYLLLTKSTTFIIGPVAQVLGYIMNAIFNAMDAIGMANVGGAIFIFTILINLILLPLTIKQQKSSKLNALIMPEIQAIQAKYKGKTDQASALKMNDETKAVYQKYGSSPTGGCLTSLIQLPILWALYQVIYHLPAYVTKLNVLYQQIVTAMESNYADYASNTVLQGLLSGSRVKGDLNASKLIDLMYTMNSDKWATFTAEFPKISNVIDTTRASISQYNTFLGINLSENPGFAFPIILIPVLAGVLQWLSVKLSMTNMQAQTGNKDDASAQTMNMMNNFMPLMSVVFTFMLPAGVGLYWVASSGVRCIIQLFVNSYLKKMDMDAVIEKNVEKMNRKRAKDGLAPIKASKISEAQLEAFHATKEDIEAREAAEKAKEEARMSRLQQNADFYNQNEGNPSSLAARAAMVQKFNERADAKKGGKK